MGKCRVCDADELWPLWAAYGPDVDRGEWSRCLWCGSDSSDTPLGQTMHFYLNDDYCGSNLRAVNGDYERLVVEMTENVKLFERHKCLCPDRTFLDVGCLEGSGLTAMSRAGWAVHGFDVIPAAKDYSPPGEHVTVAPRFAAELFPRKHSAVLCREVIEHVPIWISLLAEMIDATHVGGLIQIQTPRPYPWPDSIPYQNKHLQLFSPLALRTEVERMDLEVLEHKTWDRGQVILARKVYED